MYSNHQSPTLDDVFSSKEDSLVDADIIEAVKENIQPLQKGRRATALSAIFSTPHAQRDALLSHQRAQFRQQITHALEHFEEEESADPLDVYSRYVAWTLESYPQGQSAESGLLELLEEATRKLKDTENYKQDPRYFKLWSLYASYVDKPSMIYAFLLANEIGTNLAQLYEEYAYVHERDGRRREADEMYCLGVARKAQPLDHLQRRHAEFQRRMISAPLPAPPSPPRSTAPPIAGRRSVLASTTQPSRTTAMPVQDVFLAPKQNTRLQVYVDPAGEMAQWGEPNAWPDLGTRVSRTKENTAEILKMGNTSLPRRHPTPRSASGPVRRIVPFRDPPARGSFAPFRDEENFTPELSQADPASSRGIPSTPSLESFRDQAPDTSKHSFTPYQDKDAQPASERFPMSPSTLLSPVPRRKEGGLISETEALRKDPFKNYDVPPEGVNT